MLKRVLTYLILAIMVQQTAVAQASDLNSAFSTLIGGSGMASVSGPGAYKTDSRNVFVAGGVEARFPRARSVSLLSITPPTMPTAGCGGISAHFGGFSFVSGAEIEQLIRNIGQNAVGMVVSVVIKTLCPICDAVIQAMTKLAAAAAKLSIDSCAVAQNIVSSVIGEGSQDQHTELACGKKVAVGGKSGDYLAATQGIDAICASAMSAMETVQGFINSAEGKGKEPATPLDLELAAKVKLENRYGNTTWNLINDVYGKVDFGTTAGKEELRNRMMLLNVLGTSILVPDQAEPGKPIIPTQTGKTISPKQLFDLFMCGAPKSYTDAGGVGKTDRTRTTMAYCEQFYGSSSDKTLGNLGQDGGYDWNVWECPPDDLNECLNMRSVPLRESTMLQGSGFLYQTEGILLQAVDAVANNKGPFSDDFMKLVATVNFPLYQAVNAAAIYPASAGDLMSTMSVLVAESLVYAKLEAILTPQGKNPNPPKIRQDLALRVYDVLEAMNKMHLSQKESYGRMMTIQEGAAHSIRQINLAIQKQVMSPELLGNAKYGQSAIDSITTPPQN